MPNFDHQMHMRSYRAGRLGEEFCERVFGAKEPRYEIKTTGAAKHNCFVVQAWQLLESLNKQYVVVRYHRACKSLARGKRKGVRVYCESIEDAFKKPVEVYVVRGCQIAEIVLRRRLYLWCVASQRNIMKYGKLGLVWRIPVNELPVEELERTDKYVLYGDSHDPPGWKFGDHMPLLQSGLFEREPGDDTPTEGPVKEASDGGQEELPF